MDLLWVVLFLVTYYVRPQEWFAFLNGIHAVQLVMIGAIAVLFVRERGIRPRDFFRTPHDWLMLLFWTWMWVSSEARFETFTQTFSYFAFYAVVVQSLTSVRRMEIFLACWTALILFIAVLAIASQHGFDPLGSYDLTQGKMKGRLTLNLSIFKNPNALGHNVVPAIAMIYFLWIWNRPLFTKEVGLLLLTVPTWCIYQTTSKGAFISAAATLLATVTFGRPRFIQGLILAAALAGGGAILWSLPRMQELNNAKSDAAIMGRVAAFQHGIQMYDTKWRGVGYGRYVPTFIEANGYRKASHSSFVQMATELGFPGFLLFWGLVYCCLRTLLTACTQSVDEERVRRLLFVLLFAYLVSSWMVDLGYRPTFFLFAGAIAAFHRYLLGLNEDAAVELGTETSRLTRLEPAWMGRFRPLLPQPETALAVPRSGGELSGVAVLEAPKQPAEPVLAKPVQKILGSWNRFGLIDLAFTYVLTVGAVHFWRVILQRM